MVYNALSLKGVCDFMDWQGIKKQFGFSLLVLMFLVGQSGTLLHAAVHPFHAPHPSNEGSPHDSHDHASHLADGHQIELNCELFEHFTQAFKHRVACSFEPLLKTVFLGYKDNIYSALWLIEAAVFYGRAPPFS